MVEHHLLLKDDKLVRALNAKDIAQEAKPKRLAFALFLASPLPLGGKLFCGRLLLCGGHILVYSY